MWEHPRQGAGQTRPDGDYPAGALTLFAPGLTLATSRVLLMRSGSFPGDNPQPQLEGGTVEELRELDRLATWLDTRFRLPGTNVRFGLDALFGLVPGIGDALVALPGIYILVRAHRIGVPRRLLIRMISNLGIDWLVGTVPVLGDIFDVAFKANRRNVDLLKRHFETEASRRSSSGRWAGP